MSNSTHYIESFKKESLELIKSLFQIVDHVDDDLSKAKDLETFGQYVDRIMGGVKIIALDLPEDHIAHQIAAYTEICKTVAYKASQITDNENLLAVSVAFLADATEVLETMVNNMGAEDKLDMEALFNHAFLDRLRWISGKFGKDVRGSVSEDTGNPEEALGQEDIDELMKKLGIL
ncbi:MAG: hypothetical protein RJB66_2679 [Pseudomonadota bacterium]|jgi:hypothetical protein